MLKINTNIIDALKNATISDSALATKVNALVSDFEGIVADVNAHFAAEDRIRSLKEDIRFDVTPEQAEVVAAVVAEFVSGRWAGDYYKKYRENFSLDGNTVVVNINALKAITCKVHAEEVAKTMLDESLIRQFIAHRAGMLLREEVIASCGDCTAKLLKNKASEMTKFLPNRTYAEAQATIASFVPEKAVQAQPAAPAQPVAKKAARKAATPKAK